MKLNRGLSLVLLVFVAASLNGCLLLNAFHGAAITLADAITGSTLWLDSAEAKFNTWLGKPKDDRMKAIGPPDKCAVLSDGGEVCEWSAQGVYNDSVRCSPDYVHGGHECSGGGGGSWEHHVIYTYRDGIATEWSYRGSLGERSSRDSQTKQAINGNKLAGDNPSQTKVATPEKASVRQSPREIALVGFPLEAGASRQQIQEAILRRGGKLLSRLHSPERDEFDSSNWINGSQKAVAIYTQTGQFVGLAISWPIEDSHGGRAFVTQLRSKVSKDFGPPTRDDISQSGWPVFHQWETAPVNAAIIGEGKDSPNVLAMFTLPDQLAILNSELGKSNRPLY